MTQIPTSIALSTFQGAISRAGGSCTSDCAVLPRNRMAMKGEFGTGVNVIIERTHIGLVSKGWMRVRTNFRDYTLICGTLFIINSGCIHSVIEASEDAEMDTLLIESNSLEALGNNNFFNTGSCISMTIPEHLSAILENQICQLDALMKEGGRMRKASSAQLAAILGFILGLDLDTASIAQPRTRAEEITHKFFVALSSAKPPHRSGDYAAGQFITRSHFEETIAAATGHTPKHWIETRLVSMAKSLLLTTNWPIYDIAEKLGFMNSTVFCRFFRRLTGMSPNTFRKQEGDNPLVNDDNGCPES